ncbi:MAG TPA: polysaccharide deacetylase family protein, partial [Burkholderiales bacterium]|nr:polysaccharide deacetylase family protein [Burkholderiales bacterium]
TCIDAGERAHGMSCAAGGNGREGASEHVSGRVAWIGRLTGPKGELARALLRDVVPRFPAVEFTLVGGPVDPALAAQAPSNARLVGFIDDVAAVMRAQDVIVGGGRVPLEAMRVGKPVIAVGEGCYVGPITADTIARARATNFGDCAAREPFAPQKLMEDLAALLRGTLKPPVKDYPEFLHEYDPELVYAQVTKVYRDAEIDAYLDRFRELPVLTYHRVVAEPPSESRFNIYVTQAELDRQLGALKARGYETVTFRDIAAGRRARKPVILTFDDGYADNYGQLLPLLERHNAKAVIFALSDRTIRTNAWDAAAGEPQAQLMDDAQLRACHASGRVEIGSHGLAHRHLPQLDDAAAAQEITDSKRALEALVGGEIVSFAYPYGEYGAREVDAVKRAGYMFGIGTVNGPLRIGADRYRIRRITVFPNTGRFGFWKKTSGYYLRYCKLKGKDF